MTMLVCFQAMVIIAWSPAGTLTAFFDEDVFRSVLSIFITAALLNFIQGTFLEFFLHFLEFMFSRRSNVVLVVHVDINYATFFVILMSHLMVV